MPQELSPNGKWINLYGTGPGWIYVDQPEDRTPVSIKMHHKTCHLHPRFVVCLQGKCFSLMRWTSVLHMIREPEWLYSTSAIGHVYHPLNATNADIVHGLSGSVCHAVMMFKSCGSLLSLSHFPSRVPCRVDHIATSNKGITMHYY